jgi:hypothetical protein
MGAHTAHLEVCAHGCAHTMARTPKCARTGVRLLARCALPCRALYLMTPHTRLGVRHPPRGCSAKPSDMRFCIRDGFLHSRMVFAFANGGRHSRMGVGIREWVGIRLLRPDLGRGKPQKNSRRMPTHSRMPTPILECKNHSRMQKTISDAKTHIGWFC